MFGMSWQLPRAPLLGRFVTAQSVAVLSTLAAGAALSLWLRTSPSYPFRAVLLFGVIGAIALGHLHEKHPFATLGPANQVTTLRAAIVALVAALIAEPHTVLVAWTVALLALTTTILDGVDGWLARRSRMASDFGARYDMEVDALLIMALAVIAWEHHKAGAWIVLAGALRYLFVGAGYLWRWMNAPLPPSTRRKAVCVLQIVGLGVVVCPFVTAPVSAAVAALTLASLAWSFGVDVLWLRRNGA
jgi:phosphatidylglycerophosphate synthase